MTGVRTMGGAWAAWASGIVLTIAAIWLTRVDVVLPASALGGRQIFSAGSPQQSQVLGMRLEDAAGRPGVAVREVEPGSPAARAGVQPGDILLFVDDQLAGSARQVTERFQGGHPAGCLMLELVRAGSPLVLSMHLRDSEKPEHADP